ncbi:MAG: glycoside hydrolase family 20 zincin-like fold domain-containing protein, partial [Bacteroidales bacterium]|nr:glycoside hydrolase family 20 zincin-like fold domain-containing protein [Bacteroidales bacterium]
MKLQLFTLLFSFIAISITAQNKDIENKANDYLVIPQVNKLQQKSGQFSITENTKISRGDYLKNEGNYLADMLSLSSGFDIEFAEENGDIQLILDQSIENNEGYQLSIRYDEITITGKTAKGVFYGIQTLRQLMPATIDDQNASSTTITIPAVDIVDAPRFSYRGM